MMIIGLMKNSRWYGRVGKGEFHPKPLAPAYRRGQGTVHDPLDPYAYAEA